MHNNNNNTLLNASIFPLKRVGLHKLGLIIEVNNNKAKLKRTKMSTPEKWGGYSSKKVFKIMAYIFLSRKSVRLTLARIVYCFV